MIRPRRLHLMANGLWVEEAPSVCSNGHPLGANTVLVGARACSCGIGHHRTHRCRACGDTRFTPELGQDCRDASFDGRGSSP